MAGPVEVEHLMTRIILIVAISVMVVFLLRDGVFYVLRMIFERWDID